MMKVDRINVGRELLSFHPEVDNAASSYDTMENPFRVQPAVQLELSSNKRRWIHLYPHSGNVHVGYIRDWPVIRACPRYFVRLHPIEHAFPMFTCVASAHDRFFPVSGRTVNKVHEHKPYVIADSQRKLFQGQVGFPSKRINMPAPIARFSTDNSERQTVVSLWEIAISAQSRVGSSSDSAGQRNWQHRSPLLVPESCFLIYVIARCKDISTVEKSHLPCRGHLPVTYVSNSVSLFHINSAY
jgi:hypothetical protein